MTKRHLHKDYGTSYCGKDISHVLATFEKDEADCAACLKAADKAEKHAAAVEKREAEERDRAIREEQKTIKHALAEEKKRQKFFNELNRRRTKGAAARAKRRTTFAQRGTGA